MPTPTPDPAEAGAASQDCDVTGHRRVVTGTLPSGQSVVVSDERIEPIRVALVQGAEFVRLWACDQPAALPSSGAEPTAASYIAPPGGFRFGLFTVPPDSAPRTTTGSG